VVVRPAWKIQKDFPSIWLVGVVHPPPTSGRFPKPNTNSCKTPWLLA